MNGVRLLVHCCCVHCSAYTLNYWRECGFEVTAYWFNPNIQPEKEHEARLDALKRYLADSGTEVLAAGEYSPGLFEGALSSRTGKPMRCSICYGLRLESAAREAANARFDGFTTSLLISPQQQHEMVLAAGIAASDKYGVNFRYADIRKRYSDSRRLTRPLELYRQRYCGCLHSAGESENPDI